jgi:hypothetical protein
MGFVVATATVVPKMSDGRFGQHQTAESEWMDNMEWHRSTEPRDGTMVVNRAPKVRLSTPASRNALAVRYRDHWYYIDDRDYTSKATFFLLHKILAVQMKIDGAENLPVLTLPVGG